MIGNYGSDTNAMYGKLNTDFYYSSRGKLESSGSNFHLLCLRSDYIVAIETTARKYSPRTLWKLSATLFCATVVFVRNIVLRLVDLIACILTNILY